MAKRKSPPQKPRKSAPARQVHVPEVLDSEDLDEDSAENSDQPDDIEQEIDSQAIAIPEREGSQLPATLDEPAVIPSGPTGDLLKRYMEEVRRHPLLSPEEEIELASRMLEKGDREAAKRLVQANLRLVVKIAMEYRSYYANLLDLIQEGNVGLMRAVSKFDPTKGARLGYYASWWIRSYILKYLLDNFRLVKIGKTQAQKKLFYHLVREQQRLEAQGLLAGPKLLAEKLNVREKDVVDMGHRLSGRGPRCRSTSPSTAKRERRSIWISSPMTRSWPTSSSPGTSWSRCSKPAFRSLKSS